LKINNGFYDYGGSGPDSPFKRKITLQKETNVGPNPDEIKVAVRVMWKKHGKDYQIEAASRLYNWRQGFKLP
jgi:hypothetical protein